MLENRVIPEQKKAIEPIDQAWIKSWEKISNEFADQKYGVNPVAYRLGFLDAWKQRDEEVERLKVEVNTLRYKNQVLMNAIEDENREKTNAVNAYLDQRGLNQNLAQQICTLKKQLESQIDIKKEIEER